MKKINDEYSWREAMQEAAIMVTHDERILDLFDTVYEMEDGHLKKRQ